MKTMKFLLKPGTLCAVMAVALAAPIQAQEVVNIAEPNWASGKAIAGLIKVIIDTKLGGKSELVPGTNAVVFKGMDRGKGEIDVHPDVWLPNQANFTSEYVDDKKTVALSKKSYKGRAGFCVSKAFSAKYKVKSIFDIATPEMAKLMDRDGDGKGDIWVGAAGWASTKLNLVKVRDYGVGNFFKAIETEEEIATAAIKSSMDKGEGYAFYCYSPHYNWFLFDMVMLEEPTYDPVKYKMVQPTEDPKWFEKSKITTGDSEKSIHVGYSKSLEKRTPSVAKFLSNIDLDTTTVNGWTYEIVVKKRDSQDVAREWIGKNSARVDRWLGL
jgi:glycine betaine/proline transport system substrate-binding protein